MHFIISVFIFNPAHNLFIFSLIKLTYLKADVRYQLALNFIDPVSVTSQHWFFQYYFWFSYLLVNATGCDDAEKTAQI